MGKLFLLTGDYMLNSKGKDAIVNAANKYMEHGGGICGVIYSNAGPELISYCKDNYSSNMVNGEVRITPGFNIGMDIIHVLAPVYYEVKDPINELLKGYNNMLDEILKHNYKNVLICSLGTGVFGYNHDDVAKPLIELLNDFCKNNDVNIYLNNMYPTYKDIYLKEYLRVNNLDIKKDLANLDIDGIKKYLYDNNLVENDIKSKYNEFVKFRDIKDCCLTERLIMLQYVVDIIEDVKKEDIEVLIR